MHTYVCPSENHRAIAIYAQSLPSLCKSFQKFLKVLANAAFEVKIESEIWVLDIKNIVVWNAWLRVSLLVSGTLLRLQEKARTNFQPGRRDVVVICLFRSVSVVSKKTNGDAHVYLWGRIPIAYVKHILLILCLLGTQLTCQNALCYFTVIQSHQQ